MRVDEAGIDCIDLDGMDVLFLLNVKITVSSSELPSETSCILRDFDGCWSLDMLGDVRFGYHGFSRWFIEVGGGGGEAALFTDICNSCLISGKERMQRVLVDEKFRNEEHLDVDSVIQIPLRNVNNDSVSPSSRVLLGEEDVRGVGKCLVDSLKKARFVG
ncbi:hypothetical protein Tco_0589236 [Tanacetum coccineum]